GRAVHALSYAFHRMEDGSLVVRPGVGLPESMRGHGFGTAFNKHMEAWYHYSGVDHIELNAASTVGGFYWAREGFDWRPGSEHAAKVVFSRLGAEVRRISGELDQLTRWEHNDPSVDIEPLRRAYQAHDPADLRTEMERQRAEAREILKRATNHKF